MAHLRPDRAFREWEEKQAPRRPVPSLPSGIQLPRASRAGMQTRNPDFWAQLTAGNSSSNGMGWFVSRARTRRFGAPVAKSRDFCDRWPIFFNHVLKRRVRAAQKGENLWSRTELGQERAQRWQPRKYLRANQKQTEHMHHTSSPLSDRAPVSGSFLSFLTRFAATPFTAVPHDVAAAAPSPPPFPRPCCSE